MAAGPLANGNWKGWLVGIAGTLIAAAVTNGIVFQRETREALAIHTEQMKRNSEVASNILKYLESRIGEQSDRTNRLIDLLSDVDKKVTTAPEIGRELRERDATIQRLEKRVEELEKRGR